MTMDGDDDNNDNGSNAGDDLDSDDNKIFEKLAQFFFCKGYCRRKWSKMVDLWVSFKMSKVRRKQA